MHWPPYWTGMPGVGWSVIAATELEFTLLDASGPKAQPPINPVTGRRLVDEAVLSMAEMDAFDAFFTELYDGCAAMGIPAQTAISESGIGQFEINLNHQDAMRCADDTWLFKALTPRPGPQTRVLCHVYGQTLCRGRRQRDARSFLGCGPTGPKRV